MNTDTLIRAMNGDLFVGQSRVLLENVVTAKRRGETAEQIRENFPTLTLQQVYGALVYYLDHQNELDVQFADAQRALDELHAENRATHAAFFDGMRARLQAPHSEQSALDGAQTPTVDTALNA